MTVTKLTLFLAAAAAVAIYLAQLPRLTFKEKRNAFFLTLAACPVVGVLCYLAAGAVHHDAYQASAQPFAENTSGLVMLSGFVGLVSSALLLWGAQHVNDTRTYEGFLDAERREAEAAERAKIAAQEREERMLAGRVALAQLERQNHLLAFERDRARLQVDEERAAVQHAEQAFVLAYQRYCSRVDPLKEKDESTLVDGFRTELGRRSIGRIDMKQLDQSTNALVQKVLHGRPTVALTP